MNTKLSIPVSFGLIGGIFMTLKLAPWHSDTLPLLSSMGTQLLVIATTAVIMVIAGILSSREVKDRLNKLQFLKMAIFPSAALFFTTILIVALYCLALVATGDFGSSIGIFGSFAPETLAQHLMGTAIVFIVGSISFGINALIIGYLLGLLSTVFLNFEYFARYNANSV